jgi:obg-like ATPase 1
VWQLLTRQVRSCGNVSLADKAKKEELATVERILKCLTEDNRDVRKGTWNNKEVSNDVCHPSPPFIG